MSPAADSKRLLAALTLSCLLHATVIYLPYLGASSGAYRPAVQGGQKAEPARILNATLALEKASAAAVAEDAIAGASVADASAQRIADEEPRPALDRARGIGLLPLAAPSYYTADQLTKRPRPVSDPQLDVPEIGPVFTSGTVILKLWISELGDVVSVEVEKTELPEAVSRTAVAAFRKLHFIPGEIYGRRVGTLMRIEVSYDDGTRPPP